MQFVRNDDARRVDVLIEGKPFTSYIYPDESLLKKPVLFPIRSARGALITRGWPLEPRVGERVDHPHHVGLWLNYEDVNGFDYWNNSNAIVASMRNHKFGTIRHTGIKSMEVVEGRGRLVVTADWIADDGRGPLTLREETTYLFSGTSQSRTIDRATTLTAVVDARFNDVKDGLLGLRVARELEQPSPQPDVFLNARKVEEKAAPDNSRVVGRYRSSEGIEGDAVWSTRGRWVNLRGKIGEEEVSVAILDHNSNPGAPTYWHARGYGLFAANPLGQKVFSKGKESLNLQLAKGESVTFRFRVLIQSGALSDAVLNAVQEAFSQAR